MSEQDGHQPAAGQEAAEPEVAEQEAAEPEVAERETAEQETAEPRKVQRSKQQQEPFDSGGTESSREMREVSRRRRDAEEKLQQHLLEAKDKPAED